MLSNSYSQDSENSGDNVFEGIPVGSGEDVLFRSFISAHDFADNTVKAIIFDMRKFAHYFFGVNNEPYDSKRVSVMDVRGFKRHLRENIGQSVSTINRALVSIRRYFDWLVSQGHLQANPAKQVKELRRQELPPKGLERSKVRKLFREVELRKDVRANCAFSILLYSGCRVSDLVQLELQDIMLNERSGTAIFRYGKGGKQRQCPLPMTARRAISEYLVIRPPVSSQKLLIGERGALTDRGIRALCDKYTALLGFKIHPHLLRHTMAHQFLKDSGNDIVALAQILGHENIQTTSRYSQRSYDDLAESAERLEY